MDAAVHDCASGHLGLPLGCGKSGPSCSAICSTSALPQPRWLSRNTSFSPPATAPCFFPAGSTCQDSTSALRYSTKLPSQRFPSRPMPQIPGWKASRYHGTADRRYCRRHRDQASPPGARLPGSTGPAWISSPSTSSASRGDSCPARRRPGILALAAVLKLDNLIPHLRFQRHHAGRSHGQYPVPLRVGIHVPAVPALSDIAVFTITAPTVSWAPSTPALFRQRQGPDAYVLHRSLPLPPKRKSLNESFRAR